MTDLLWPLSALRVRTPLIELRYPSDDDLLELAEVAGRGVHAPDFMPFIVSWSTLPSPKRERSVLQWHWRQRAEWTPQAWNLALVVVRDGHVVGSQGFGARHFARLRTVSSGSWLGLDHQGRGTGKEMRSAMLHLAFDGLGARVAYSGAWDDNAPSIAVSRSVGYVENGDRIEARGDDQVGREILFKIERERWDERRRDDITIEGLEGALDMFVEAPEGESA